jgi:phosphoribosyl-AMP cyclohydrolase / phosphoribosyl-ATP pyrophosphohydrolase
MIDQIDFQKGDGLVPVIVQDFDTREVLMLGYMNNEALQKTTASNRVTFYSRSKQRLWTKGEESGNYLEVKSIELDCDQDSLLIQAIPVGPTCHTGTTTCWGERTNTSFGVLRDLEATIKDRKDNPDEHSYVSSLFKSGINKVAQKVGEEAVEVVIEAKDNDENLFLNESADLLFHYLILLQAKGYRLEDVMRVLKERRK